MHTLVVVFKQLCYRCVHLKVFAIILQVSKILINFSVLSDFKKSEAVNVLIVVQIYCRLVPCLLTMRGY